MLQVVVVYSTLQGVFQFVLLQENLGGREKYSWQSFTMFMSVVWNNFIRNLFMTKSSDRIYI